MRDLSMAGAARRLPAGGAANARQVGAQVRAPVSSGLAFARRASRESAAMSIVVRPARKDDAEQLAHFYRTLSPRSRLQRFHGAVNQLPAAMVARFAANDHPEERTLLAVLIGGAAEAIVGEGRLVAVPGGRSAEFALSVADAAQGIGIGRRLARRLLGEAATLGVATLHGDVLPDNLPMLALAGSLGFAEALSPGDTRLRRIERPIEPAGIGGVAAGGAERAPAELGRAACFEPA
jgi:GNAT superfamily N-acetyltransferase